MPRPAKPTAKVLRVVGSTEAEQDQMRLDDLVQQYGLSCRATGKRFRFEEEEFTARNLREALAFAEGFDRARQS